MLFALLFALVGGIVVLLLLARAAAGEAADGRGTDGKLVERLIDLAVRDQAAAMRLLREHPELRAARYLHDETPLHFCAVEGLADGVRFLAGEGMPVDATNQFGDTALVDAVTVGNLEMTKLLLRLGANPNAASLTRGSVLQIAKGQGDAKIVAALLGAGARGAGDPPPTRSVPRGEER